MGPRSDNRGYAPLVISVMFFSDPLQWVHGRITVVMLETIKGWRGAVKLQWVHGRITVVMGSDLPGPSDDEWGFNGSTVG